MDQKLSGVRPDYSRLQQLFANVRQDGFDVDGELKWGFFFIDDSKANLEKLYDELRDHNYKLEKLEQVDGLEWKLEVSKVESLAAEKLHRRNTAFNELAERCNVKLYDGWDVGQP